MGTPGRWKVGADPSVGEEQGAGLPGTAVPGHPRSPGSSNPGPGAQGGHGDRRGRDAGGALSLGVRAVGNVSSGGDWIRLARGDVGLSDGALFLP